MVAHDQDPEAKREEGSSQQPLACKDLAVEGSGFWDPGFQVVVVWIAFLVVHGYAVVGYWLIFSGWTFEL